tara:strand:+ start:511 stop:645 length:135 start_codon:yes stop_codon:yes gene_type:complete
MIGITSNESGGRRKKKAGRVVGIKCRREGRRRLRKGKTFSFLKI